MMGFFKTLGDVFLGVAPPSVEIPPLHTKSYLLGEDAGDFVLAGQQEAERAKMTAQAATLIRSGEFELLEFQLGFSDVTGHRYDLEKGDFLRLLPTLSKATPSQAIRLG